MESQIEKHYRGRDIQEMFGIGQSTMYEYIQQGILPQPIKLGRTSIWLKSEIDEVVNKQKLARKNFKLIRKGLSREVEIDNLKKEKGEVLSFVDAALENLTNKDLTDNQKALGIECLKSARSHLSNGEVVL